MNAKISNIVFVSDFFLEQGVTGGAEFYNDNLMKMLSSRYEFIKIQSSQITPEFTNQNKESFYIIANFMALSDDNKKSSEFSNGPVGKCSLIKPSENIDMLDPSFRFSTNPFLLFDMVNNG